MESRMRVRAILGMCSLILLTANPVPCDPGKGSVRQPQEPSHPGNAAVTVEPAPPLSLSIRLAGLQKYRRGGVASVVVEAASEVDLESVVISVRLPENVTFADGTRGKSWDRPLGRGKKTEIPADLLLGQDGTFVLSAEATATLRGMPIHRGLAITLSAGGQEKPLPVRDGAIEYPGVPGDGGN